MSVVLSCCRAIALGLLGVLCTAYGVFGQSMLINGSRVITGSMNYCADAGSTDAYACNLSPAIAAYRTGTRYTFLANTINTGAATLNLNSLGAKTIKKWVGAAKADLTTGDIQAGQQVDVIYDGTDLQMLSQLGQVATATATIASGTIALATSAISSGTCATEQIATATGTLTTDVVMVSLNQDITGVTGYTPSTNGTLRIDTYPKSGQIGLRVCNATASSITPGAVTLNYRVVR
jgi:hypothetical protein